METTCSLSQFITTLSFDQIPFDVVQKAKQTIIDTIGVGLAGSKNRAAQICRKLADDFPMGSCEAAIWGVETRTSCLWATLLNSMAASCLDADDGHRGAKGHPAGVIVPTALAAAERKKASGRELLTAVVTGYEVAARIGSYLNRDVDQTFYGSGTWTTFGAAAAAAKIFTLDEIACENALGICEVNTPLSPMMNWIKLSKQPEVKEGMSWSAFTGMTSALLAERGLKGTFTLDQQNESRMITYGLGQEWEISKSYFKKYPSCRWTHPPLDGIFEALQKHTFRLDEIVQINILSHKWACHLINPYPESIEQAQYSIPFVVASALVKGTFGPREICREQLNMPEVLALSKKVSLSCDTDLDDVYPQKTMARIKIKLVNGREIVVEPRPWTKGDCNNPFSQEELLEKFHLFGGLALNDQRLETVANMVMKLENIEDVNDLSILLLQHAGV